MNQSLVSVIVPVYNVETYLPRCLDSLLAQTYTNLEIIAVNDGSPDDSASILDVYAKRDQRIRPIHKENGGVSSARNAGLDAAVGKYVLFVDGDDWLEPTTVELLAANADGCDIVQANLVISYDNGIDVVPQELTDRLLLDAEKIFGSYFYNELQESCCNKLFRRDTIGDIRFDEQLAVAEDSKFVYTVLQRIETVRVLPQVTYHYFERSGSCTHQPIGQKHFDVLPLRDQQCQDVSGNAALTRAFVFKYSGDLFHLIHCVLQDSSGRFCDRLPQLRKRMMRVRGEIFRHPRISIKFKVAVALLWIAPPLFYRLYRKVRENG